MAKPTLLPCPFCGGQPFETELQHLNPRVGWYWVIGCGNEDCPVDGCYSDCPTYEEAVAAWNRRARPAGAQGAVAYRLTMRSGVSDRNDNVVGDFNDRITATVVGALLKDADCLNAPEYSRFDIDPVTHPPAASEDAVDAARYRWLVKLWAHDQRHMNQHGPEVHAVLDAFKSGDTSKVDAAIDAARDGEGESHGKE